MSPLQEGIPSVGLHIIYEPEKSDSTLVDVVFVHGLGGHPIRSWQHDDSIVSIARTKTEPLSRDGSLKLQPKRTRSSDKKYRSTTFPRDNTRQPESNASPLLFWPQDLLPVACPEARVITWGYHTLRSGDVPVIAQPDLFSHAKDLLRELGDLRDSTDVQQRPLVFIAHSLGGIIVKEVLRQADFSNTRNEEEILSSTAAAIFFGCPHRAVEQEPLVDTVVSMAEASFSGKTESSVFSSLCGVNNPRWGEAQDSFVRLWYHFNFVVKTYQEKQSGTDKAINGRTEASKLGDMREDAESLPAHHHTMCVFKSASDAGFKSLSKILQDIVRDEKLKRRGLSTEEISSLRRLISHRVRGRGSRSTMKESSLGSGKSTQLQNIWCQMKNQWKPAAAAIIYCTAEGQSLDGTFVSGPKLGSLRSITTIRSIVSQLFEHDPNLREKLSSACEGDINDTDLTRFFLDDYITGKPRTLARRTFILIDAEDSCDDEYIRELLYCLGQIGRSSNFSVCLASRPVSEPVPTNITKLQLEDHNLEDIKLLVQSRLRASGDERPGTVKNIVEKAGNSFLWAQLATNLLNKVIDDGGTQDLVDQVLGELPTNLYGLYEQMLGALSCKEKADATTIMRWVMLSPEPMMLNDLRMAVRLGRTNFLLCCDPQSALDVGLPWSMQELQKTGKQFDTPSQFYQWLCSQTCGLLEARSSDAGGQAQQSLGLQHVYPINDSVKSFFLSGRGFAVLSSGRVTTTPPDHKAVDLCHYSLLRTILVYLNTSDLSPLVSGNHSPEPKQSVLSLETSPTWRRTVVDQRNLITSSYPFLGYAVDNLLYHLLSPRPLRYFLPQQAIFNMFACDDCRIWRRWTALLGETDASAVLAKCRSAEALLQPEFGASFRLERVFRAVNKMATGDSWFSPRKGPVFSLPRAPRKLEDEAARQKSNSAPSLPSLPLSRAAQRGPRSRGTVVVSRTR
ncbi:hypothetical protein F4859DRAFT_515619 [Xylaria cf. heliscus]|nr:hypothetical protein F4859DRAFT_515619 [Xylaria cf. heliscus]